MKCCSVNNSWWRLSQTLQRSTTEAVRRNIARYSRDTARIGALTVLASVIPSIGMLIEVLIGNLADMPINMKYHVEMTLSIAAHHGFISKTIKSNGCACLLQALVLSSGMATSPPGGVLVCKGLWCGFCVIIKLRCVI